MKSLSDAELKKFLEAEQDQKDEIAAKLGQYKSRKVKRKKKRPKYRSVRY